MEHCVSKRALSPDASDSDPSTDGEHDASVRIWDAASGRELTRLDGHTNWVWSVAWSPNGTRLASASNDASVRIWDAASGPELAALVSCGDVSVVVHPDGSYFAHGDVDDQLWWAIGDRRVELSDLARVGRGPLTKHRDLLAPAS